MRSRSVDSDLTTHSMILDSISRRFVVVSNLQNSFPAGSFPRENWLHYSFSYHVLITEAANVDAILFSQTERLTSLRWPTLIRLRNVLRIAVIRRCDDILFSHDILFSQSERERQ